MREAFLARLLRYAIYISALMPLIIFSQFISPFHFGKIVVFRSIVEFMLVGYLMLWWQDKSYKPRTNIILWSFLAFTAAFSIATITSIQPYMSFWGTLERMGGLWTFFHYLIFFVILTSVLRKQEHWEKFLNISIFTALLSALYGFGQKTEIHFFIGSGGRERIFGTIGNAALFAGYEIVNVFLALTLWVRKQKTSGIAFLYVAEVIFGSLAVIMTVVRGSLLGLGAGFLMFSFLYFLQTKSSRAKKSFLALMTLAIIGLIIIVTPIKKSSIFQESRFLRRIVDTSFQATTTKTRFWAWQAGLKGWSESSQKIIVGWGPENFNIPFSKYFNPKFFTGYGAETLFDRAHNMFVEILVTMGLLGLLTYLSIFYASFHSLIEIKDKQSNNYVYTIGFSSLIVAYIIHNSFIFDTSANLLIFTTILGFIAFLVMRGQGSDIVLQREPQTRYAGFRLLAGILLLIATTILVYQTNIIPSKANYATTRGIIRSWSGDFKGAVDKFKEAMQYNVAGKYEFRHRYGQFMLEYANDRDLTSEIKAAIELAIQEITKNRDDFPNDYLPELYLSRLNIILGREDAKSPYNDIALQHSLRALEISPTFIRTFYEVGQVYLNKKDYENAIKYFKRAAELNPDVGVSYWYWGLIEITRSNTDEGLRIVKIAIEKGYAPSENDYLRLADIYVKRKDYSQLVTIYENLTNLNPNKPQYFASLAVAYANVGRIDDAIDAARRAVMLDPAFLSEAQAFARQLGREL